MTATAKTIPTGAFTILAIMSALACFGNALVLTVVLLRNAMKRINSTYALIGNLAITDLVYSGISMPLTLAASTMGQSWTLGNAGCKLVMFLPNFCIAASIITMIAIASDRRSAVVNSKSLFGSTNAIITVNCAIWVLSFAFAAPALYEYSVYEKEYHASGSGEIKDDSGSNEVIDFGSGFNPNDTYLGCGGSSYIPANFEKVYASFLFVFVYLLPLLIISANYLSIWLFVRRKAKEISKNMDNGVSGSGGGGAISKGKYKILQMLLMVVFVFAVAWAPYFAIFVREEVTGADDTAQWGSIGHIMKLVMAIASSLLNPIIYAAFNGKLRQGFKAVLTCRFREVGNNRVAASSDNSQTNTAVSNTNT